MHQMKELKGWLDPSVTQCTNRTSNDGRTQELL